MRLNGYLKLSHRICTSLEPLNYNLPWHKHIENLRNAHKTLAFQYSHQLLMHPSIDSNTLVLDQSHTMHRQGLIDQDNCLPKDISNHYSTRFQWKSMYTLWSSWALKTKIMAWLNCWHLNYSVSRIIVNFLMTTNLGKHLYCSLVHLKKFLNTLLLRF